MAALQSSNGRASPVRTMKPTCAAQDPGLEQERINVTFLWIKQHVSSCPLFKAGVACCLPTCAQGSSFPVTGFLSNGVFWAFWLLLGALCIWRVLAWLVCPLLCTGLGSCWTRPLGGGRWGHYLCDLRGDCWAARESARYLNGRSGSFINGKP